LANANGAWCGDVEQEKISTPQYELLTRLRHLVSEASRAPVDSINPDDAVQFVGLALSMAASLDSES